MAKVTVQKAGKEWVCGRCKAVIPVGTQYKKCCPIWRSKFKVIRCMDCGIRASEQTGNSKQAALLVVAETIDLRADIKFEDVESLIDEAKQGLEEVQSEYEESADNIEENFGETERVTEFRDMVDQIDQLISGFDDIDHEVNLEDHETLSEFDDAKEEVINALMEAAGNIYGF